MHVRATMEKLEKWSASKLPQGAATVEMAVAVITIGRGPQPVGWQYRLSAATLG